MRRAYRRAAAGAGAAAAALLLAAPAAASIGQPGDAGVSLWRVAGALLFCLLLAAGAAFAMRARLRGSLPPLRGQAKRLKLVESLRLSHQVDLCLIDLDGRELLVAATAQGARLLLHREAPQE